MSAAAIARKIKASDSCKPKEFPQLPPAREYIDRGQKTKTHDIGQA